MGVAHPQRVGRRSWTTRGRFFCSLVVVVLAASTLAASHAATDGPPQVRLPADVTYRSDETSPGPVVFSHATHVPLADDRCTGCHPALVPDPPTHRKDHARGDERRQEVRRLSRRRQGERHRRRLRPLPPVGRDAMSVGLLYDSTRCIACGACSAACKEANDLPLPIEDHTTAYTWTVVEEVGAANVRRLCFHCAEPTCVSVCPVAALQKTAEGPVDLRRAALHRLPLLHHGLPVRRAEVPVGPARPHRRQVHPLRRPGRATGCRPPAPRCARRGRRSSASATTLLREARTRIASSPGRTSTTSTASPRPAAPRC